jgi:epsilon-lactone hydrolase
MSWQSELACWMLQRSMRPSTSTADIDVERTRAHTSRRVWLPHVPKGWKLEVEPSGEWIRRETPARSTILYLHGGGYYFCSPRTHRAITFGLAKQAQANVFALEYRLAPEHRFPAAVDDALDAYRSLLSQGIEPENIVIAGDSAGGGLALGTLLALRDARDPLPSCAVLFSPWTDLTCSGESMTTNDGRDPMFHSAVFPAVARQYLGDADARHPYASPLFGDLEGLPPMLIQVGDTEILLDDSTRVAEKARASNVEVDLQIWRNVPHIFQIWSPFMPEARRALKQAGRFIEEKISA